MTSSSRAAGAFAAAAIALGTSITFMAGAASAADTPPPSATLAPLPGVATSSVTHSSATTPAAGGGSTGSLNPTGCANGAVSSNFHEQPGEEALLPLQQLPADVASVPTWQGSFTTNGTTYPFTMVGTDPAAGSATTHVPVELIPLNLDFAGNGCVLGDPGAAADLEASPLFTPTPLPTGTTQYLDNYQRTDFWSTVSAISPGYHLVLDASAVSAVTLHVPAAQGITVADPQFGITEGIVGGNWLYHQLTALLASLQISPNVLAAFVPYNTYVTDQNPNDCVSPTGCAYYTGFHEASLNSHNPRAINTFAYATYLDDGSAVPAGFDLGAQVLSHEIMEWANDPFDNASRIQGQVAFRSNSAPAWSSPYFGAGTFCTSVLEVADPLEESFAVGVYGGGSSTLYLLANAAFLPWFARQSPASSAGLFDLVGEFATYSTAC